MKFILVLILFLFSKFTLLYGQNYPILFNDYVGLPSNVVYDCAESNTGKLWIATDKGLCKYDGYSFENVPLDAGLTTLVSWGFFKDKKGRLWLRNREYPFTYIYNDSVHRIGKTKGIKNIQVDFLNEDQLGNIYISSFKTNKTHLIKKDGSVEQIDSTLVLINSKNKFNWLNYDSEFIFLKITTLNDHIITYGCNTKGVNKIKVWNTINNKEYEIEVNFIKTFQHICRLDNEHVLISGEAGIYKLNIFTKKISPYNTHYNTLFKDVVVIYTDRFNNKWFCDFTKGIWFFKAVPDELYYHEFETNVEISHVALSNENRLYITTNKDFHYQIDQKGIHKVINNSLYPADEYLSSDKAIIDFYKSNFYLSNSKLSIINTKSHQFNHLYPNQTVDLDKNYEIFIGSYKYHLQNDKYIHFGTSQGVASFERNEDDKLTFRLYNIGYTFDIKQIDSKLYCVGLNGLKIIDLDRRKVKHYFSDRSFTHLCYTNNYLYLRTEDGIILKVDINTLNIIREFHDYKFILKLKQIDNEIWGISENGIFKLNPKSLRIEKELNAFAGVINPYKKTIKKVGEYYYLICKTGLYRFKDFPKYNYNIENLTHFKIQDVIINGVKADTRKVKLSGSRNFVQINLSSVYFPFTSRSVLYFYRINNGAWNQSYNKTLTFVDLPYGDYALEIKAKFVGEKNFFKQNLKLSFNNPAPFYTQYWFIILVVLCFSFLITLLILYNRKRRFDQLKQQFEFSQNRMKMLVMQMKPHFLSNILNSLQNTFLNDDPIKSSQLISDLDNYLRSSLSNSNKDMITLLEELTLSKKYFDLEIGRLKKEINYELSPALRDNMGSIIVPVFILQPIIENAIWHGIQKSKREYGSIKIDLNESGDYFIISVEDDGIGFGNSNYIGNSVALNNINERLSLIDKKRLKKYLYIESLNPGTKVSIYVRKNFKDYSH
ncbi:MAG TPA: histidine kinase [Taishania sp.]|nr:histidine kinase [Taishania sp.]